METLILPRSIESMDLAKSLLLSGNVIGIPTETVYGLAANAFDDSAIQKVFEAKKRPQDNPLIVHVSSLEMLATLLPNGYVLPTIYVQMIEKFWPGPLTILLPRGEAVSKTVTAGHDLIAVRMPSNKVARDLIEHCGFPLAAPSANLSGRPSPTTANHVYADLKGRIPLILDGGPCQSGLESTVVDGLRVPPAILRPGGVTAEQLCVLPGCEKMAIHSRDFTDSILENAPTTPGMKYRHYTPNAPVILFESSENVFPRMLQYLESLKDSRVGVLSVGGSFTDFCKSSNSSTTKIIERSLGQSNTQVAASLFDGLRELESQNVTIILAQGVSEEGAGLAVMNRLRKASLQIHKAQ